MAKDVLLAIHIWSLVKCQSKAFAPIFSMLTISGEAQLCR